MRLFCSSRKADTFTLKFMVLLIIGIMFFLFVIKAFSNVIDLTHDEQRDLNYVVDSVKKASSSLDQNVFFNLNFKSGFVFFTNKPHLINKLTITAKDPDDDDFEVEKNKINVEFNIDQKICPKNNPCVCIFTLLEEKSDVIKPKRGACARLNKALYRQTKTTGKASRIIPPMTFTAYMHKKDYALHDDKSIFRKFSYELKENGGAIINHDDYFILDNWALMSFFKDYDDFNKEHYKEVKDTTTMKPIMVKGTPRHYVLCLKDTFCQQQLSEIQRIERLSQNTP